jgi:hypothetical protein
MKKNDVLFLLSSIAFSVLFYEQNAGLNWLLFTLMVGACLLFFNPEKLFDAHWWYYAALAILASSMVMFVNSILSILASICAIIMLCGKTANRDNSVFIAFGFSVFSLFSSLVYWVIDMTSMQNGEDKTEKQKNMRVFTGITISLLIALVFFYLYREANPLFKDFTKDINFDWFSIGWVLFTFLGFLILYGLIKNRRIKILSDMDSDALKKIPKTKLEGEEKVIKHGAIIALSLFVILNGMLLLINLLDFHNIFINQALPKGITLSNFVHQAVWSIVVSIVVASLFIMVFFKDDLNFSAYGKKVKLFVYAWIIQSIIMVLTTMIRNSWYIQEYQLTELRIGVYTFLLLSLIGLVLTFRKVAFAQSAWHLVTRNFSAWFLLLCLSPYVNWEKVITNYNIAHASEIKKLDRDYLARLTDANIPELVELYKLKDTTLIIKNNWETPYLDYKLYEASEKIKNSSWQGFNLRDLQNKEALKSIKFVEYGQK